MIDALSNPWLKPSEVAQLYSVEACTLAKWRQQGVGPPYSCLGRDPRYRLSDLVAYMDERRVSSTTEARTLRREARQRREAAWRDKLNRRK